MAAQGKNTGLQVGLIIAIVVALIGLVAAFIFYRADQEANLRVAQLEQEKRGLGDRNEELFQELSVVKQKVGTTLSDVGLGEADPGPGTVLGELNRLIAANDTGSGATNLKDLIETLRGQLDDSRGKQGLAEVGRDLTKEELRTLEERKTAELEEIRKDRDAKVADLADVQNQFGEQLRTVEDAKRRVEDTLKATQVELEEERERLTARIESLKDEVDDLTRTNERVVRKLNDLDTGRFTTPSGKIVNTEPRTGLVVVNIGKNDNLRPGVTFTVYDKDLVGPSGADNTAAKGKIEIVRVGTRTSEARVLEKPPGVAFTPQDPIHSPIWSPGRKARVAFVGLIDLDGDGSYLGERDRLNRILNANGAEISVFVDDEGAWIDGDGDPSTNRPIDQTTEMLVLADTPDPAETPDPKGKEVARKILEAQRELRKQAFQNGVNVVTLRTFLESVGYQPKRRRYAPGDDADFNLKRGGGRAADPNPGVTTSALFDPDRERRRSNTRDVPGQNRFNPRR